ncbi:hypothetical protein JOD43_001014 [Pullulanibacillus pueri]|uniref:hypothetical protein n=1 Tax=Pullulanibacillus pueri TaxID=1437324 RepID=UPI00166A76F4|nr:hypothetical protein [Pullulanibacillus pueri]MBM7680850.1 hypothetical protein [Pullulanibacillus pueri]
MVLFVISGILFNTVVYKMNKHLTMNHIVQTWSFTMIFLFVFDIYVDGKWHGYWYFSKEIDWHNLLVYLCLIPPVNVIFLNWFPFKGARLTKFYYSVLWLIFLLSYEILALSPRPWGYFHYGWWHLFYSILLDPVLLMILLVHHEWVCKIEKSSFKKI